MSAGHADGALAVGNLTEHLRASDHGNALACGSIDFGVCPFDGGSHHERVGTFDVSGVVADGHGDSATLEELGGRGLFEVAAGDRETLAGQDPGNATHPDSADADEMNVLNVL